MDQKYFTHLNDYNLSTINEKKIIFDTNVLVNLYHPEINKNSTINQNYISKIEDLLIDCKVKKIKIKVMIPIISEFYNLALNAAFEDYRISKLKSEIFTKKDYRETPEFKISNAGIIKIIDDILSSPEFEVEHYNFEYKKIKDKEKLLSSLDFTDLIISKYCEEEDVCLVTLDSDFRKTFRRDLKFSIISN